MKRRIWIYVGTGIGLGILLGIFWGVFQRQESVAPTVSNRNTNTAPPQNTNQALPAETQTFTPADLPERDAAYNFEAKIPSGWIAEYVTASQAINFYDPAAPGVDSFDRSKVFVTFFRASDFETLKSVNVKSRTTGTVAGRPAVTYIIEKKTDAQDFIAQPKWRNLEHRVTDIRISDNSPSDFLVFAKNPSLPEEVFDSFLASLTLGPNQD